MTIFKNIKKTDWQFYMICLLTFLSIGWSSLYISLFPLGDNGVSVSFKVLVAIMDGAIGLLPFLLLRGKWRFLELLPVMVVPLVALANVLFFRNYGDLIPGRMYFMSQITDPMVTEAAAASFRAGDVSLLILQVVTVCLFVIFRKAVIGFKVKRNVLVGSLVTVPLLMLVVCIGSLRRACKWNPGEKMSDVIIVTMMFDKLNWQSYMELGGFWGYMARCSFDIFKESRSMSIDEANRIKGFLNKHNQDYKQVESSGKDYKLDNLILIVVESLTSKAFDYPEKEKYMPYLASLEKDSTTLVVKNVIPQVTFGQSSDGQFMYNTGLLPLQEEALVMNYGEKDYPSLAKALAIESAEVIGEDKSSWRHSVTTRSYGFGFLHYNSVRSMNDKDREIFEKALTVSNGFKGKFFLFITTLTMHDLYTEAVVENKGEISPISGFTDEDLNYIKRLNYFDNELSKFIAELKACGLYDKSLIVIASDHQVRRDAASKAIVGPYIPWIIINSPVTGNVRSVVRQVDLFSTILEIFGKDYRFMGMPYRGVGRSILHADEESSARDTIMEKEKEISRLLITRKYSPDVFRNK